MMGSLRRLGMWLVSEARKAIHVYFQLATNVYYRYAENRFENSYQYRAAQLEIRKEQKLQQVFVYSFVHNVC